jgi:hypothetical protein
VLEPGTPQNRRQLITLDAANSKKYNQSCLFFRRR